MRGLRCGLCVGAIELGSCVASVEGVGKVGKAPSWEGACVASRFTSAWDATRAEGFGTGGGCERCFLTPLPRGVETEKKNVRASVHVRKR